MGFYKTDSNAGFESTSGSRRFPGFVPKCRSDLHLAIISWQVSVQQVTSDVPDSLRTTRKVA